MWGLCMQFRHWADALAEVTEDKGGRATAAPTELSGPKMT